MALPNDWNAEFANNKLHSARFICPHCTLPSTFEVLASNEENLGGRITYYATLKCNYTPCQKRVFVITTRSTQSPQQNHSDSVTIYPSRAIPEHHRAIPPAVGGDWTEAQKAYEASAIKAAAVMCRRVLYGVLLDKKCKEHPLHEGIKELCEREKLPGIVEQWLNEIKEDGHDAAHPHRTLLVPTENVAEAMEYTKELLRFTYIEPFELEERLKRKAGKTVSP